MQTTGSTVPQLPPADGVAETSVTPSGRSSVTWTELAVPLPWLNTESAYVNCEPTLDRVLRGGFGQRQVGTRTVVVEDRSRRRPVEDRRVDGIGEARAEGLVALGGIVAVDVDAERLRRLAGKERERGGSGLVVAPARRWRSRPASRPPTVTVLPLAADSVTANSGLDNAAVAFVDGRIGDRECGHGIVVRDLSRSGPVADRRSRRGTRARA